MDLLQGGIKNIVHDALKDIAEDLTIHRALDAVSNGRGGWITTPEEVPAKGFMTDYNDFQRLAGMPETDREITVIAGSFEGEINRQDKINMRGDNYEVINVKKAPAQATYVLQVR